MGRRGSRKKPEIRIPVDTTKFGKHNSWGDPDFVTRGYYVDIPFTCSSCSIKEVFTAEQQKWWYEVAKGYLWSTARRCKDCRDTLRDRAAESRKKSIEGAKRSPPKSSRAKGLDGKAAKRHAIRAR